MKIKLFFGMLFLTTSLYTNAQEIKSRTVPPLSSSTSVKSEPEKDSPDLSDQSSQTSTQTSPGYLRPNSKKRFNRYVKSMVGPLAIAKNVVGAGISTATNSPEEWGPNWKGFGRRVASNFGKSVIKNTTQYALDETLKLDSGFYRSEKRDFGSRVKNAVISPFTARTKSGRRVFGVPRLVGTYSAGIIAAETWYPKRFDYKNGLRSGTISLGTTVLFNLFKEFFKK